MSTFGTYLFEMEVGRPDAVVGELVRSFIIKHFASLGLAPGVQAHDLGLAPSAMFRSPAGKLTIYRFDQDYRSFPVFGADTQISVVATHEGVISIRGAIADARIEYRHVASQANAEIARSHILHMASAKAGLPEPELTVSALRLVAFPRARSLAWAANVTRGVDQVATVLVEANFPKSSHELPLLYYSTDVHAGLAQPMAVEVFAERLDSDVVNDPIESADQTMLFDGSSLLGSFDDDGEMFQLAGQKIVAFDGSGVDKISKQFPPVQSPKPSFSAPVGDLLFNAQTVFVAVANMYAWTDRFMSGKWESSLSLHTGNASLFPPEEFFPRILLYANAQGNPCGNASWCEKAITPVGGPLLEAFRHPVNAPGPEFETISQVAFEFSAPLDIAVIGHEFGHSVDEFAKPGIMDAGFGCAGPTCQPSCVEGTTDESAPLAETWANLFSIWQMRSLSPPGAAPDNCDIVSDVSVGNSPRPHHGACAADSDPPPARLVRDGSASCPFQNAACVPKPSDPLKCTNIDICDKPEDEGFNENGSPTGLCSESPGYRTDSVFQAFWELMHGESCAVEFPYPCTALEHLTEGPPEDRVGEAMLFALRVNSATYDGFADDVATFISCNFGPEAYADVNEVLCHHALRDCDAPIPVTCPACGDGILEGDENCDLGEFADATCETLGFDGGTLQCTKACIFDAVNCTVMGETTASASEPGTETSMFTSASSTGALDDVTLVPTEPSVVSETTSTAMDAAGETAIPGCDCSSDWHGSLLGAAGLLLVRRRRRLVDDLRAVACLSVVAASSACTLAANSESAAASSSEVDATSEATADAGSTLGDVGSTPADETSGSDETGVAPDIDPRFFRTFHSEFASVGLNNSADVFLVWANVEIRPDGHALFSRMDCSNAAPVEDVLWVHDAEASGLRLLANDGDDIRFALGVYSAVTLTLEDACGRLVVETVDASDAMQRSDRFDPGRVCAVTEGDSACEFEVVWCDEGAPVQCP